LPDGAELRLFRQDASVDFVHPGAQELEDGAIVFVKGHRATPSLGGQLAWVRPGHLRAEALTSPRDLYASVHAWGPEKLLVSRRDSKDKGANGAFDVYTFDVASRSLGKRIAHQNGFSNIAPFVVAPHKAPIVYPSILHLGEKTGRLLCLDSHVSMDAPHGRIAAPIAQVRVLALERDGQERVLGDAPVEKDGSFYMTVPADTPVRFALLDAKGNVVHAQKSWIWVRPGEDRGCLGCHEDQALAPENHSPQTLGRFDTPTPVGVPRQTQTTHRE
jgi:hypothetical protein